MRVNFCGKSRMTCAIRASRLVSDDGGFAPVPTVAVRYGCSRNADLRHRPKLKIFGLFGRYERNGLEVTFHVGPNLLILDESGKGWVLVASSHSAAGGEEGNSTPVSDIDA